MGKLKPAEFELRIRSLPSAIPWSVRMRSMLKAMLRKYEFRVVDYRQLNTEDDDKAGSDETE